ncbi:MULTISPECIES: long-chain fatty acid--CoA ligase [unclassified Mycobacterium]|uniref:AMP-dependent synthetase/ligase n=1 Tax=unclassified Mycobacterium TaxID=2642494 RepID=UPI0012EA3A8E|nr:MULTISPECIES: AMP-dependent synthetase/ligase [unclassified Mycobacterium]
MQPPTDSPPATLAEAFLSTIDKCGDAPAVLDADLHVVLSWREYGLRSRRVAGGLAGLGIGRSDSVGLLLTNRPEFHIADAAALQIGATPFSMYNTAAPEQLLHVLDDAGCRVVITESSLLHRLNAALAVDRCQVDHVVVVEHQSWVQLLSSPERNQPPSARPEDLATLVYTSGTIGPPKGVELTHHNILTMVSEMAPLMGAQPQHRSISYLPMAHIAERASTHYLPMVMGFTVVCCPTPVEVTELLPRVRPELFFSPPRLWEKLQALVASNASVEPDPAELRRRLGLDNLVCALTGAAPCPPGVVEFFGSIGITLRELYGLSETTGVVSFAAADDARAGTVGPPLPSAEIHLAEDNELLVRGPLIMAGYRNQSQATSEAIDAEGWLHTGDLAELTADGHLRIIGRKKELIINAAGKNMSPNNIEARLRESSPLIGQACVMGDGRPYNVALLVLDPAVAATYSSEAALLAEVQGGVDRANARLARVEQIKRYAVLEDEWVPDSDELTPTMKLKRRAVTEKYAEQIDALYAQTRRG